MSGVQISQAFRGTVSFNNLQTQAIGLPNSPNKVLTAGQPVTATVLVRNTGVQPIAVGADPRLNKVQTLQPVPIQGSLTFPLPEIRINPPVYIIPPDTSSLTVAASSTLPAQVETPRFRRRIRHLRRPAGCQERQHRVDRDRMREVGIHQQGNLVHFGVANSARLPTPVRRRDKPRSPRRCVRRLRPGRDVLDRRPVPDRSRPDVRRLRHPVLIHPGEVGAIQVTITPQGHKGSVVHGHLNVVTPSTVTAGLTALPFYTTGATVSQLPYSYTVG